MPPTLESINVQPIHQWSEDKSVMHLSQDTSQWLSPQKATIQELDPLTFNIQTSPMSVLVQPTGSSLRTQSTTARKSESPTRSTNLGIKHDDMRRANSELLANSPRKPLSILFTSSTAAEDATLQSATSISDNNSQHSTDKLDNSPTPIVNVPVPVPKHGPASRQVNGGLFVESANMPQVTSSASSGFQICTSTPLDVGEGPSSSVLTGPSRPSLAQNTTAEAATLALNAAFQSQNVVGPQVQRSTVSDSVQLGLTLSSLPDKAAPQISIRPKGQVKPLNAYNIREFRIANHKAHNDSRPAGWIRWKEPISAEKQSVPNVELKPSAKRSSAGSQSNDRPHHSQKQRSVQFSTHPSHEIKRPKKRRTKKYILEAVVIPIRPPFSRLKVTPRRREPEAEQDEVADEVPLVTKTGPPKGHVRPRKPEVIKSLEQLEGIFQANVAPLSIASDDEVDHASASIVANYHILKSQLRSREPVKDESHLKAPTISYPRSELEDRFIDGIESALGPGSLFNIPKNFPKRTSQSRVNRAGYTYTSSEPEDSEIEPTSDIPAEEEQGEEEVEPDTIITEAVEDLVSDDIDEMQTSAMEVTEDALEEFVTNEAEDVGSSKRKPSSEIHPRSDDDSAGSKETAAAVDEKTINRWVMSLEVLIKGKVKLSRQDLRKLKLMLDDINCRKHLLDEKTLEASQLKTRMRQVSELAIEDIPYNDDEYLRQRARLINRFWARRVESS